MRLTEQQRARNHAEATRSQENFKQSPETSRESIRSSLSETHAQIIEEYLQAKRDLKAIEGGYFYLTKLGWQINEEGEYHLGLDESQDSEESKDIMPAINDLLSAKIKLIEFFRASPVWFQESKRSEKAQDLHRLADAWKGKQFIESAPSAIKQNPELAKSPEFRSKITQSAMDQVMFELIFDKFWEDFKSADYTQNPEISDHLIFEKTKEIRGVVQESANIGDYKTEIGAVILRDTLRDRLGATTSFHRKCILTLNKLPV